MKTFTKSFIISFIFSLCCNCCKANTRVMDIDYFTMRGNTCYFFQKDEHLDFNNSNTEITQISSSKGHSFILPKDIYEAAYYYSHELEGSEERVMTSTTTMELTKGGVTYSFFPNNEYIFNDDALTITTVTDDMVQCQCDNAEEYNTVRHASWTTVE